MPSSVSPRAARGGAIGGNSSQLEGKYDSHLRMARRQSASLSATISTCPVTVETLSDPASSSAVTTSPIPTLTTGGPDIPRKPVPRTIGTKSDCDDANDGPPKHAP